VLRHRYIKDHISYDKITGLIDCKYRVSMQEAGHMRVNIDGKSYRMAEVIWTLVHGKVPRHTKVLQLDGNKLNFTLSNLALDNTEALKVQIQKARGFDWVSDKTRSFTDV